MGKKKEIQKAGYETIQYAIKKLLEDVEGYEFHLTPKQFGLYMKEIPLNRPKGKDDSFLSNLEKRKFKRQLRKIKLFWSGDNWKVRESGGKEFKLIFQRRDK